MSDTTNPAPSFRTLTPYGCAKVVNKELEELGLPTLPPQMMYTYVNKGYIDSFIKDGKKRVSELDLAKWFQGYVAKKTAIAAAKATLTQDVTTESVEATESESE
jgi:hypothetical protein